MPIQHTRRRVAPPSYLAVDVVHVERLEAQPRLLVRRAAVPLRERAERLEALGQRRGEAHLAARGGEHEAVLRLGALVGAVGAAELLDGALRRLGQLQRDVHSGALVCGAAVRVEGDAGGCCVFVGEGVLGGRVECVTRGDRRNAPPTQVQGQATTPRDNARTGLGDDGHELLAAVEEVLLPDVDVGLRAARVVVVPRLVL